MARGVKGRENIYKGGGRYGNEGLVMERLRKWQLG